MCLRKNGLTKEKSTSLEWNARYAILPTQWTSDWRETFCSFHFILRLLLLATLNVKCGQEITSMKRKKDGKQAIDSGWNSKKHLLKSKNKSRDSQSLQPNQKCLKTAVWQRLYTLFFRGRGNSEQSFYQKWDPCRAF